ncbi:MAG: restriction endonuclease subunit S, partial [Clostridia bacterium]|nr:restriction endonuclease subunit S [Clostridia bacterium]
YLQSKTFQHRIEEISIGSTQKALTIDAIKKEVVILPCIETQQHIVDIRRNIA